MDILSHGLMGAAAGELGHKRRVLWPFLFGALPDVFQALALYPFVGYVHGRAWLIPEHADWSGFRGAYPLASAIWEAPHSLFFLLLCIVPLVLKLRLPRSCIAAYGLHLLVDVFTHSGEWSAAPFWPLSWKLEGYWDPWKAPPEQIALCVGLSALLWLGLWWGRRFRATGAGENGQGEA